MISLYCESVIVVALWRKVGAYGPPQTLTTTSDANIWFSNTLINFLSIMLCVGLGLVSGKIKIK